MKRNAQALRDDNLHAVAIQDVAFDPLDRGLETGLGEAGYEIGLTDLAARLRRVARCALLHAVDEGVDPLTGRMQRVTAFDIGVYDQVHAAGQVVEHP